MMMLPLLLPLCLALLAATGECANSSWYLVDVPLVVCSGSPGFVEIEIALDAIPEAERTDPHILTFYRTSTKAVTVDYNLTDSATPTNHTVDAKTVTLRDLGANASNSSDAANSTRRLEAFEEDMYGDFEDNDDDETAGEEVYAGNFRRLSFSRRRSSGHSTGSAFSRRRAASAPATQPAQTSPNAPPPSMLSHRRRSVPGSNPASPSASPSSAAAGAGAHKPVSPGAPAGGWRNNQDPRVGNYGYPSTSAMNSGFGNRPPTPTSYGYSGANAVQAGSGAKIAMAAGAGVLAGVAGQYAYSRLKAMHLSQECFAGDEKFANCLLCRAKHTPASECAAQFTPTANLSRDDLMDSGFVPANLTGPLRLTIRSIVGEDYTAKKLCPPVGSNNGNAADGNESEGSNETGNASATWEPEDPQDIFVTLTRLEATQPGASSTAPAAGEVGGGATREGASRGESEVNKPFARAGMIGSFLMTIVCCGLCVFAGRMFQKSMGSTGKDDRLAEPYPHPVQYGTPAYPAQFEGYAPRYPAYGQPQPYPGSMQQVQSAYRPGNFS